MDEMILTKAIDASPQVFRPWRRFWARMFDWWLCGRLWFLLQMVVFNIDAVTRPATFGRVVIDMVMQIILMLLLEPLFLSRWGTTPGKWLLGLYVTHESGRKLTYTEALHRTSGVLMSGMGLAIPIYDLVRLYLSYKACASGLRLSWDDETAYTLGAENGRQVVFYLGAVLLVIALLLAARGQAQLPKHRGELTAVQFVENVNKLNDFYDWLPEYALQEDGSWSRSQSNNAIRSSDLERPVDFELIEENGRLTEVRFSRDQSEGIIFNEQQQITLAIMAYAGAQKNIHFWDMLAPSWTDIIEDPFEDFSFTWGDVKVTYTADYSGYHKNNSFPALFSEENTPHHYQMEFVMSKP